MESEKERFIVIGFALFLTVLFISYLGPVITGDVVKGVEEITLADFPYPFIKNSLMNNVVIVVPDSPSSDELIAAQEIALFFEGLVETAPSIRTVGVVGDGVQNRIIVGEACSALVVGVLGDDVCDDVSLGGGRVQLLPGKNAMDVVVTGASGADVRRAAGLLTRSRLYHLEGFVMGTEGLRQDRGVNFER